MNQLELEQKVQIMKNLFQTLKEQDQIISQAENIIEKGVRESNQLGTTLSDQEKKISEIETLIHSSVNDIRAKESTISKTMELLNEIRDVIQSENGRDGMIDNTNMVRCLRKLLNDRSEEEKMNREKKIQALTERHEMELQLNELKGSSDSLSMERDQLEEQVKYLESSLNSQKDINQSLEDSVVKQADNIVKLFHSLKLKEDQEQKLLSDIESKNGEIKLLEKDFNQVYHLFGLVEGVKNPEGIRNVVENLKNESEKNMKENDKLREEFSMCEKKIGEKNGRILELDHKLTSLQDENSSLRSQLVIANRKVDSMNDKMVDDTFVTAFEISKRENSKLREELKSSSDKCSSLRNLLEEEKESRLEEYKKLQELHTCNLSKLASIVEENQQINIIIESIREENKTLSDCKARMEDGEREHDQRLETISKLQLELTSLQQMYEGRCKDFNQEMSEKTKLLEQVDKVNQKYEQMNVSMTEKNSLYKEAVSNLEEKSKTIDQQLLLIENLNNSVEFKKEEIYEREVEISHLSEIIDDIRSCITSSPLENRLIISSLKEMKEKQTDEISQLEASIRVLKEDLERKSKLFNDYQSKIDQLTELLEARSTKIDELEVELQFLKKENANLEHEKSELEESIQERESKINELLNRNRAMALERLNKETLLKDEIETISRERELMKEKVEKMNEALSKKVNKIDNAFNKIDSLNNESQNLSSLNKAMEDNYMKVLFEKKQLKDKYEKKIESLRVENEKLLDELNRQQLILLKLEKSNKKTNYLEKESNNWNTKK